jgi:glutaminyl-tRNA synthetase
VASDDKPNDKRNDKHNHKPNHKPNDKPNDKPGEKKPGKDFVRSIIDKDVSAGKNGGRVSTRFPPEPNGCLHIGHAKSICLNFGIASEYAGATCNLRFDDTNPSAEGAEHVESIIEDVRWLGFDWGDRLFFTSDYFDQLYAFAIDLVKKGKAFVDDQTADEIRANNGSLTEPGSNSPYRDRSVEENLDLLARMKAGEFEEGAKVLRAKIDMASPVLTLRDPIMYRIQNTPHHRTGDEWHIYPMYDFAHGQSDAIEGITHSICTLEFQDHRPLYDWFIENLELPDVPRQYEFARLNITHTVMSKRVLRELVEEDHVDGWDDPRLPTLRGLRRRGYSAASIRDFCNRIGVAKRDNLIELAQLEHSIRQDLNQNAPRVMGVLDPLKVVIENFAENEVDLLDAVNNPEDESMGTRKVPFTREIYIEREDFMEDPPRKFFRLAPGREVRLRYAYFVTCTDVIKDAAGEVLELRCSYDPATRGGDAPDGRKVKGTLHWVSVDHALDAEVRLYDHLFSAEDPMQVEPGGHFLDSLNPDSLKVLEGAKVEQSLETASPGASYQFERQGYFCVDPDTKPGRLVFNRTVTLRDTWAKVKKQAATKQANSKAG